MSNPVALAALVAASAILTGSAIFVTSRTRRSRDLPRRDRSEGTR